LITPDEDDQMPQKNEPLSAQEIQQVRKWIQGGAKFDGADSTASLVSLIPPIFNRSRLPYIQLLSR
jgi:hypothetical protein